MFRKPNWKIGDTFTVLKSFSYASAKLSHLPIRQRIKTVEIGDEGHIIGFHSFGEGNSMGIEIVLKRNGDVYITQDDTNILFSGDGVIGSTAHCE